MWQIRLLFKKLEHFTNVFILILTSQPSSLTIVSDREISPLNNVERFYDATFLTFHHRTMQLSWHDIIPDRPSRHRRLEEPLPEGGLDPAEACRHRLLPADVTLLAAAPHRHQPLLENVSRALARGWEQWTRSAHWSSHGELNATVFPSKLTLLWHCPRQQKHCKCSWWVFISFCPGSPCYGTVQDSISTASAHGESLSHFVLVHLDMALFVTA